MFPLVSSSSSYNLGKKLGSRPVTEREKCPNPLQYMLAIRANSYVCFWKKGLK